jgi:Protein of unknown function (DUF4232)
MSTPRFAPRWRVACLAGIVAVTSLLAACGSTGPSQPGTTPPPASTPAASSPTPAAPAPAPASPTPAAPAPASPTARPSGGAALTGCRTTSLRITLDASQASGTAGSAYYPLNFTNTSATGCELYGYPGVSFAAAPSAAGQQIGAAAQRSSAFAKVAIRLAPGATAHAWLKVTVAGNYPAATCHPVTARWLRVYPPGETVAGYVGHAFSACSATSTALLTVLPVRSGQGLAGMTP